MMFDDDWMSRLADDYEQAADIRHQLNQGAIGVHCRGTMEECSIGHCQAAVGRIATIRKAVSK